MKRVIIVAVVAALFLAGVVAFTFFLHDVNNVTLWEYATRPEVRRRIFVRDSTTHAAYLEWQAEHPDTTKDSTIHYSDDGAIPPPGLNPVPITDPVGTMLFGGGF